MLKVGHVTKPGSVWWVDGILQVNLVHPSVGGLVRPGRGREEQGGAGGLIFGVLLMNGFAVRPTGNRPL